MLMSTVSSLLLPVQFSPARPGTSNRQRQGYSGRQLVGVLSEHHPRQRMDALEQWGGDLGTVLRPVGAASQHAQQPSDQGRQMSPRTSAALGLQPVVRASQRSGAAQARHLEEWGISLENMLRDAGASVVRPPAPLLQTPAEEGGTQPTRCNRHSRQQNDTATWGGDLASVLAAAPSAPRMTRKRVQPHQTSAGMNFVFRDSEADNYPALSRQRHSPSGQAQRLCDTSDLPREAAQIRQLDQELRESVAIEGEVVTGTGSNAAFGATGSRTVGNRDGVSTEGTRQPHSLSYSVEEREQAGHSADVQTAVRARVAAGRRPRIDAALWGGDLSSVLPPQSAASMPSRGHRVSVANTGRIPYEAELERMRGAVAGDAVVAAMAVRRPRHQIAADEWGGGLGDVLLPVRERERQRERRTSPSSYTDRSARRRVGRGVDAVHTSGFAGDLSSVFQPASRPGRAGGGEAQELPGSRSGLGNGGVVNRAGARHQTAEELGFVGGGLDAVLPARAGRLPRLQPPEPRDSAEHDAAAAGVASRGRERPPIARLDLSRWPRMPPTPSEALLAPTSMTYESLLALDATVARRGLAPENIAKFPLVAVAAGSGCEGTDCAICLDHFKRRTKARMLPCGHKFHPLCIGKWFEAHVVCPLCRYDCCVLAPG